MQYVGSKAQLIRRRCKRWSARQRKTSMRRCAVHTVPADEMEEDDVQDTQNGPQLILVGTSGQPEPEMTNFSLPTP